VFQERVAQKVDVCKVLACQKGSITIDNTIDSRLQLVMEQAPVYWTEDSLPVLYSAYRILQLVTGFRLEFEQLSVASCQFARINQRILVDLPGRQSQQSGSCCSIEAQPCVGDLIATQVASCKHVVLGCVFEVVFLVDKRWQVQVSIEAFWQVCGNMY